MIKKVAYSSLVLLSLLSACTNTDAFNAPNINLSAKSIVTKNLSGVALFPVNKNFNIKATVADIGMNATVSLIDPSSNTTISTGLTDSSGSFTLNSGFTATTGMVYVLEATRRIDGNGNSSMSVRTFIKWTGASWSSITSPGVSINSKTTGLVSMVGLMGTSAVTPNDTIGTMPSGVPSDIIHNSSVVISAASITNVGDMVAYTLTNNLDPVLYLKYSSVTNKFSLQDPPMIPPIITTFAGSGLQGSSGDGGTASDSQIKSPNGVAVDSSGNVYIADTYNHKIRKVDTSGIITTFAGGGSGGDGGDASSAALNYPFGVAVDNSGNVYIADTNNNKIRKVDTSGIITTFAGSGLQGSSGDGGPASTAKLSSPSGVAVDNSGNVYIADYNNNKIRKVDTSGIITTFAGGGSSGDGGDASSASLNLPNGAAIDSSGNVYIADYGNNKIRKVDISGKISTLAGNGVQGSSGDGSTASLASLKNPSGVAIDNSGNIYIADYSNNKIRKVDTSGIITTFTGSGSQGSSGDGGAASSATLNNPSGVAVDMSGNVYIADTNNNKIRKVGKKEVPPM